jgi:hypothetical protein
MKTQTNFSNLKKLGLTVLSSIVVSAGVFASSPSENLNVFMRAQELSVLYQAPEMNDASEVMLAVEDLENFVLAAQADLIYTAPVSVETNINTVIEDIESFTSSEMATIMYEAPAVDENIDAVSGMESLQLLADKMASELKYRAPEAVDFAGQVNETNDMIACR